MNRALGLAALAALAVAGATSAAHGRTIVIAIWGDMPAHGHGLPTQPRARELGGGVYALEGMKFQMGGAWVVELTIRAGGARDLMRIRFTIQ
jgi:hypothetical protein